MGRYGMSLRNCPKTQERTRRSNIPYILNWTPIPNHLDETAVGIHIKANIDEANTIQMSVLLISSKKLVITSILEMTTLTVTNYRQIPQTDGF